MGTLCLWLDSAESLAVFDTLDGFVDVVVGERRVTLDRDEVADLVTVLGGWLEKPQP